jgi:hypothetical protein
LLDGNLAVSFQHGLVTDLAAKVTSPESEQVHLCL